MVEIKPYKNQDYALLKSQHNASNLFVDREFPATLSSLFHVKTARGEGIQWKRPKEVFGENAQFVVDGFKRGDLGQGKLGNCWFIAACAAVTLHRDLLVRVIPPDQSYDNVNYAGIFHFRFWLFGTWYDVVVDDLLPFQGEKLVYCHNVKDPNEMWVALLEKAYAKVCGSYEASESGRASDALIDMTAGVNETYQMFDTYTKQPQPDDIKKEINEILHQAYTRKSMIGCAINADRAETEDTLPNGLMKNHAYSVTRVKDVTTKDGKKMTLIRCRNPWGDENEWNGDWSDQSKLWDTISDEEKARLKYRQKHDGEFWMSFDDFYSNFHDLDVCHRGPSSLTSTQGEKDSMKCSNVFEDDQITWQEEAFHGEWVPGESAGGSSGSSNKKFWTNPQYLVKLVSTDDVIYSVDEDGNQEGLCTMIVSLMQKDQRQHRVQGDKTVINMQFLICKVNDGVNVMQNIEQGKLKFYGDQLEDADFSGFYVPDQTITKRFNLPPGTYVIIPSTHESDQAGKFLLRIFTEKPVDQTVKAELDRDKKNLTDKEVSLTKKDFVDTREGANKLPDAFNEASSTNDSKKKPTVSNTTIDKKEPKNKEELCSLQ